MCHTVDAVHAWRDTNTDKDGMKIAIIVRLMI